MPQVWLLQDLACNSPIDETFICLGSHIPRKDNITVSWLLDGKLKDTSSPSDHEHFELYERIQVRKNDWAVTIKCVVSIPDSGPFSGEAHKSCQSSTCQPNRKRREIPSSWKDTCKSICKTGLCAGSSNLRISDESLLKKESPDAPEGTLHPTNGGHSGQPHGLPTGAAAVLQPQPGP
ncbi:uncharacterized protein LOC144755690 [Lissotriton helveticus]